MRALLPSAGEDGRAARSAWPSPTSRPTSSTRSSSPSSAEAAKQGVEVVVVDAKGDAATQVSQIQDFITQHVDAIIYIPAGATAAGRARSRTPRRPASRSSPSTATRRTPWRHLHRHRLRRRRQGAGRATSPSMTGGEGQVGDPPGPDRHHAGDRPRQGLHRGAGQGARASRGRSPSSPPTVGPGRGLQRLPRTCCRRIPTSPSSSAAPTRWRWARRRPCASANLGHKVTIVGFDGDFAGLKAVRDGTLDATMTQHTQAMGRLALQSARDADQRRQGAGRAAAVPAYLTTKDNVGPVHRQHP